MIKSKTLETENRFLCSTVILVIANITKIQNKKLFWKVIYHGSYKQTMQAPNLLKKRFPKTLKKEKLVTKYHIFYSIIPLFYGMQHTQ